MAPAALRIVEGSSMDKTKALSAALSQIERQFGKGSVMRLGKNDRSMDIETISSGSLGLDIALGVGGLPKGRVVEIYGPESSGKTTLALHTVAEAQKKGGICAFIDAEHALDPVYARKLGVNVDELLISQPDHGEQALEIADTLVSSGAVDVLVNNAGITRDTTFKKMDKVNWDAVIRTNLDSLFNMTKQVADGMVERGWGRILNISSVNGSKGAFGQTNYSAAKAGVHGFTKALALEVAKKGVTVNTISPGYIGTKMVTAIPKDVLDTKILPQIPVGRLGKPEEVAGLVIYLASEEAAFLTGANIAINGGQHMQ